MSTSEPSKSTRSWLRRGLALVGLTVGSAILQEVVAFCIPMDTVRYVSPMAFTLLGAFGLAIPSSLVIREFLLGIMTNSRSAGRFNIVCRILEAQVVLGLLLAVFPKFDDSIFTLVDSELPPLSAAARSLSVLARQNLLITHAVLSLVVILESLIYQTLWKYGRKDPVWWSLGISLVVGVVIFVLWLGTFLPMLKMRMDLG